MCGRPAAFREVAYPILSRIVRLSLTMRE